MSVAILHYSAPPVVGGVESVIEAHSHLFTRAGVRVRTVAGAGESASGETLLLPELAGAGRYPLSSVRDALDTATQEFSTVFVHNMLTMPFDQVATGALWELAAARPGTRWVSWIHDIAAANPDYSGLPPSLRCAAPGFEHVTISARRQAEYAALTGLPPAEITVVPNGITAHPALGLTPPVAALAHERGLFDAAPLLLHPARLLARKNIPATLDATAALRAAGHSAHALVTAANDPHTPGSASLREALARHAEALGIASHVTFIGDYFSPSSEDIAALYRLADALFFPSHQEGFGLPLLEAGLHRLPAFCTDAEPMRSVLGSGVTLLDPAIPPEETASLVARTLASDPAYRARRQVLDTFSWEKIFETHIAPRFLSG